MILRTRGSAHRAGPSVGAVAGEALQAERRQARLEQDLGQLQGATSGVALAGLRMTALPAASAGATLCSASSIGKLNGVIATTTPHGTRSVRPNLPAPLARGVERQHLAAQLRALERRPGGGGRGSG